MEFKGLYTALVTPFTPNGDLDVEGLITLIRLQNEASVDGIVVLGTTGESSTLEPEERHLVVTTAIQHSTVPVLVGTGANSTRKTIDYTLEAEALGAAAALIVAPYYNRPTQEGLFLHFNAIHEATQLPIMLYNNPGRCGVNILPETVLRLSKLERIKGIKEASGSLAQLGEIIEKGDASFAVLTGDDAMAMPSIALGAVGLVSVLSNLYPAEVKAFVELCLENRLEEARVHHHRWAPLLRALFAETNPILVKAAMRELGLPAGGCRAPLCEGSEAARSRIADLCVSVLNMRL